MIMVLRLEVTVRVKFKLRVSLLIVQVRLWATFPKPTQRLDDVTL